MGRRFFGQPAAVSICTCLVFAGGAVGWGLHEQSQPTSSAAAPTSPAYSSLDSSAFNRSVPVIPEPVIQTVHGVRFEDDWLVQRFLGQSVRCRTWVGGETQQSASTFDLMRLRTKGFGSPPFEYEVRKETTEQGQFVLVREHIKNRDGSDLARMPGFVVHRYQYDPPNGSFELVSTEPEDRSFDPRMLRALGDPRGFLAQHWDAVCNGRRSFPELRPAASPTHTSIGSRGQVRSDDQGQTPLTAALLDSWAIWNDKCRGGPGDSPDTAVACEKREYVSAQIEKAGMCHGEVGQAMYERVWHQCGPRSCRLPGC